MSMFARSGMTRYDVDALKHVLTQISEAAGERLREHDEQISALRQEVAALRDEVAALRREPHKSLRARLREKNA